MRSPRPTRRASALTALLAVLAIALPTAAVAGDVMFASPPSASANGSAAVAPFRLVEDRDLNDRLAQPEDRYALASGCYAVEAPGVGFLAPDGSVVPTVAGAEGFHFRATRLGEYLLATDEGPDTTYQGAWWDERDFLSVGGPVAAADPVAAIGAQVLPTLSTVDEPSPAAEWRIVASGPDPDAKIRPGSDGKAKGHDKNTPKGKATGRDQARGWQTYLAFNDATGTALVAGQGTFSAGDAAQATPLAFHHITDPARCAVWPEVDVNATGRPAGNDGGSTGPVQGFFESHVHGMAFEFLGGAARCGRPWHPYGVEYALVDCPDHGPDGHTAALEFVVSGTDPATGHDPIGWPTFGYWPNPDSLTHEQFYYRWLERAYLGGLRLVTNLFVDNTALCQVWPIKKNSCNEMDGVRLQAQRIHELQDYIDAQSGGPGEGWFRIVTTPAQARETINAGRLAVVLGIEVSVLFDCGEIYDQPQCTPEQIDERLTEAFDMGVRQMELINKFDNALSGVTGDGGATGLVVNVGNRHVTGHFWDMRTCAPTEDGHDHEHDKRQTNFVDDNGPTPREIDVLAGQALQAFGATRGYVAPFYPAGPHCNSRGLSDLGRTVIRGMVDRGMIFDPDHMSAAGARQALDFIEDVLIPEERAAAAAEGRAPIQPAVVSSHSWANDEIYKRIYELRGMIGPRTNNADGFAKYWADRKQWAAQLAPGELFGLGYGADTNGFGGQPGSRSKPAVPVTYDQGWQAPIGGVTLHQQVSGFKAYDINVHGVAHYGLFADWFRELQLAADQRYPGLGGGAAITRDMLNGSEAYIRMWERGVYGANDCVVDGSMPHVEDLHAAVGLNLEGFLRAVGQPISRDDAAYTYCAADASGAVRVLDVTFADGRATDVRASTSDVRPVEAADAAAPVDAAASAHGDTAAHDHASHDHDDAPALALSAAGGDGGAPASTLLAAGPLLVLLAVVYGRRASRRRTA